MLVPIAPLLGIDAAASGTGPMLNPFRTTISPGAMVLPDMLAAFTILVICAGGVIAANKPWLALFGLILATMYKVFASADRPFPNKIPHSPLLTIGLPLES